MRARDGGVETGGGDGSEMGSMTKKIKFVTGIGCQPHPGPQE